MSVITNLHNLAFSMKGGFVAIQECDGGYEYSVYDVGYRLLDGGVYDCPDKPIMQVLGEIMEELHSGIIGGIEFSGDAVPVDYDELMEKVNNVEKTRMKEAAAMSGKTVNMVITFLEFQELMVSELRKNTCEEAEVITFVHKRANETYNAVRIVHRDEEHTGGYAVVPILNMDFYYKRHMAGESISLLAKEIISLSKMDEKSKMIVPSAEQIESLQSYEAIKDKLFIRVIGKDRNREYLAIRPNKVYGDFAVVCCILLENLGEKGEMTVCINDSMMETYAAQGATFEEIYELARKNSTKLFPPFVEDTSKFAPKELIDLEESYMPKLYAVSNRLFSNGAGVIFYDGILEMLSEEIGEGGDLLIIPSSVNEVLVKRYCPDMDDLSYMEQMISAVNTELDPELLLSYKLHYYEASTGFFGLASEKIGKQEVL